MSKNTPNQSSGGGKKKSQPWKKEILVNDDDDFEESLYKKPNPINSKKNTSKTISSPGATRTGDVKRKKNADAGKTVSSSAATEPDSDDDFVPCTFGTRSQK
jgi:hypothetical protein